MDLQQLNEYMSKIEVSRDASKASDLGLPDDDMEVDEPNLDPVTIIADGKLLAERYLVLSERLTESGEKESLSYEDYESFVEKLAVYELGSKYEGRYEFHDCFYRDVDVKYSGLSDRQIWFSDLFWTHIDKYFARTPDYLLKYGELVTKCSRCSDIIEEMDFYDRGMCADCNEDAFGVSIIECEVCCDVNYVNSEGRCHVCSQL